MTKFLDGIAKRVEEKTGARAESIRAIGLLMWRAVLLGSALFLMLGEDSDANLTLNGVSYIGALIWAYYDGIFSKRRWSLAWLEAMFLHLLGVQVANLPTLVFGNPVLGT